jgi:predicted nucleic acid-binding protein
MLSLLDKAGESERVTDKAAARARKLAGLGFDPFDALHLAMAEQGQADIFLTVDDRLMRLANRLEDEVQVPVKNPLAWIRE